MGSVSYPTPLALSLSQLSYIESGTMLLHTDVVVRKSNHRLINGRSAKRDS